MLISNVALGLQKHSPVPWVFHRILGVAMPLSLGDQLVIQMKGPRSLLDPHDTDHFVCPEAQYTGLQQTQTVNCRVM